MRLVAYFALLASASATSSQPEDTSTSELCNGDPHANITDCPFPCPVTCENPNAGACGKNCPSTGCQCVPGYIPSETYGRCVLPDDCPGGNPCGANGTYSECGFRCPNQDCPVDDSRTILLCKPGRPCPPGCMCKENYKRLPDGTCVLASDCPVVECTRPNEVWNSCSSECLAEMCADMYQPNACDPSQNQACIPKCVCMKGHFRDENDMCVAASKCPNFKIDTSTESLPPPKDAEPCNNSKTNESKSSRCIATCAEPHPTRCARVSRGGCAPGHILSQRRGMCIKIEDCPQDLGCNGDKNAVIKSCVRCRSSCAHPNSIDCEKECTVGCSCKPGLILSMSGGKCIQPDQCKGGNPCGPNGTFVDCYSGCPTDYCPVDDNRGILICETFPFSPCYSNCRCNLNYRIKSNEDRRCILASECPRVNCTRPNEKWNACPSDCLAERCTDIDEQPSTCNTLVLNCQPRCICEKDFFRNSDDICISKNECRKLKSQYSSTN